VLAGSEGIGQPGASGRWLGGTGWRGSASKAGIGSSPGGPAVCPVGVGVERLPDFNLPVCRRSEQRFCGATLQSRQTRSPGIRRFMNHEARIPGCFALTYSRSGFRQGRSTGSSSGFRAPGFSSFRCGTCRSSSTGFTCVRRRKPYFEPHTPTPQGVCPILTEEDERRGVDAGYSYGPAAGRSPYLGCPVAGPAVGRVSPHWPGRALDGGMPAVRSAEHDSRPAPQLRVLVGDRRRRALYGIRPVEADDGLLFWPRKDCCGGSRSRALNAGHPSNR